MKRRIRKYEEDYFDKRKKEELEKIVEDKENEIDNFQ